MHVKKRQAKERDSHSKEKVRLILADSGSFVLWVRGSSVVLWVSEHLNL